MRGGRTEKGAAEEEGRKEGVEQTTTTVHHAIYTLLGPCGAHWGQWTGIARSVHCRYARMRGFPPLRFQLIILDSTRSTHRPTRHPQSRVNQPTRGGAENRSVLFLSHGGVMQKAQKLVHKYIRCFQFDVILVLSKLSGDLRDRFDFTHQKARSRIVGRRWKQNAAVCKEGERTVPRPRGDGEIRCSGRNWQVRILSGSFVR